MGTIINYIRRLEAFEPGDIDIMAVAYQHACKILGQPDAPVREMAARRIIERFKDGERDALKLTEAAVEAVKMGAL